MTVEGGQDDPGTTGSERAGTRLVRWVGIGAIVFGVFLAAGMVTAIAATYGTYGETDSLGTLADWGTATLLIVVGAGLKRGRSWARKLAPWVGVLLVAFGTYLAATGKGQTRPGAPFPNPITESAVSWGVFLIAGSILLSVVVPAIVYQIAGVLRRR